jgi:hypothetical protein
MVRCKGWFVVITAVMVLAGCVEGASAARFSVSTRNIRAVWNPLDMNSAGLHIRCPITLEGSFHSSTLTKVRGALVGYISRASVLSASCEGSGTATVLQAYLPWHVRYDSFRGTLPSISGVRLGLVEAAFEINVGFLCLFAATATNPLFAIAELRSGVITGLQGDLGSGIPLFRGIFLCPEGLFFTGTATVAALGTTSAVTIRLI